MTLCESRDGIECCMFDVSSALCLGYSSSGSGIVAAGAYQYAAATCVAAVQHVDDETTDADDSALGSLALGGRVSNSTMVTVTGALILLLVGCCMVLACQRGRGKHLTDKQRLEMLLKANNIQIGPEPLTGLDSPQVTQNGLRKGSRPSAASSGVSFESGRDPNRRRMESFGSDGMWEGGREVPGKALRQVFDEAMSVGTLGGKSKQPHHLSQCTMSAALESARSPFQSPDVPMNHQQALKVSGQDAFGGEAVIEEDSDDDVHSVVENCIGTPCKRASVCTFAEDSDDDVHSVVENCIASPIKQDTHLPIASSGRRRSSPVMDDLQWDGAGEYQEVIADDQTSVIYDVAAQEKCSVVTSPSRTRSCHSRDLQCIRPSIDHQSDDKSVQEDKSQFDGTVYDWVPNVDDTSTLPDIDVLIETDKDVNSEHDTASTVILHNGVDTVANAVAEQQTAADYRAMKDLGITPFFDYREIDHSDSAVEGYASVHDNTISRKNSTLTDKSS